MYISTYELDAVAPYDFELTMHKPSNWYWYNPTEIYSEGKMWTGLRLSSGRNLGLRLKPLGNVEQPRISLAVFSSWKLSEADIIETLETVSECTGIMDDIKPFYSVAKKDPILEHVVEDLYGMRREARPLSRVINFIMLALTLQNAPISRTYQMLRLLITRHGRQMLFDGRSTFTWPTVQSIVNADVAELREECKLGYRAGFLKTIADEMIKDEFPSLNELAQMPLEEAKEELMKLKGIGEYSAEVILPHPEAFPVDSWSAKIFWKLLFPGEVPPSKNRAIRLVREQAEERWGRWRSLAFVYVLCDISKISMRLKIDL